MDLELNGRIVFVAGSTRGIGLGIAEGFLHEGARVAISGRDTARLNETVARLSQEFGADHVLGIAGNLSDAITVRDALEKIVKTWSRLDVLVANVGAGGGTIGWDVAPEEWQRAFDVNLWTTVRLAQAMVPLLKTSRGNIVFISSITGVESTGAQLPYSAAKAALNSLSKNLARELGRDGVRVNAVAPGNILFPGGTWEQKLQADPAKVEKILTDHVPLRRFGTPDEIADAVTFLASPRASFITGALLVADGGQTRS